MALAVGLAEALILAPICTPGGVVGRLGSCACEWRRAISSSTASRHSAASATARCAPPNSCSMPIAVEALAANTPEGVGRPQPQLCLCPCIQALA